MIVMSSRCMLYTKISMKYAFIDCQVEGGNSSAPSHLQNEEPKALPTTKYAKTITEVETIMSKLKKKHGQQYDIERYACWAHTIHSGKHSSYDQPPDLPYFTHCKKKSNSQSREDGSSNPYQTTCDTVLHTAGESTIVIVVI